MALQLEAAREGVDGTAQHALDLRQRLQCAAAGAVLARVLEPVLRRGAVLRAAAEHSLGNPPRPAVELEVQREAARARPAVDDVLLRRGPGVLLVEREDQRLDERRLARVVGRDHPADAALEGREVHDVPRAERVQVVELEAHEAELAARRLRCRLAPALPVQREDGVDEALVPAPGQELADDPLMRRQRPGRRLRAGELRPLPRLDRGLAGGLAGLAAGLAGGLAGPSPRARPHRPRRHPVRGRVRRGLLRDEGARRVLVVEQLPVQRAPRQGARRDVAARRVQLHTHEAVVVGDVDAAHARRGRAVRRVARACRELPEHVAVPQVRLADVLLDEAPAVGGAGRETLPQVDVAPEGQVVLAEARRREGEVAHLRPVGQQRAVDLLVEEADVGRPRGRLPRRLLRGRGRALAIRRDHRPYAAVRRVDAALPPVGQARRAERLAVGHQRREEVERARREAVRVVVARDEDDRGDARRGREERRDVLEVVGRGPHLVVEHVARDYDQVRGLPPQALVEPGKHGRVLGAAAVLDVDVSQVRNSHLGVY